MSYQALYRKYRPSTLEDVIGQDVVIKILKNSIKNNMVGHAYMLSGPRGIGKTSIAKLLAKIVNCNDSQYGDACGKCENCQLINSGFSPDIIEIDAASNNGVDEIREIKNKINLVPNQLKYKVYIIDEVHMLSIGAFNALLKTLEEPPEHIIFILATTDLHKVPTTIISRCQCFEFHRISNNDIVKRLSYICEKENITVENEVLENIAVLSDGGLRDAVGMLDKLNAYSNSNITLEDFEMVNGIVSKEEKLKFFNYIVNNDIKSVIEFIDKQYDGGKDLIIFSQDMLTLCKNLSISYYLDNDNSYDINFLLDFSNMMNDILKNIIFTCDIKTILEISILSFMNKRCGKLENNICDNSEKSNKNINDNDSQLVKIEEKKDEIISREIILEQDQFKSVNKHIVNNCFARANKQEKSLFESGWSKLNDYALDSEYGAVACFLTDSVVRVVGEGEIIISFGYESMVNRGVGLLDKIEKLIEKIYNKHYDVALLTNDEWNIEKDQFINNKNNNIKYEYVKIEKKNIESNNCVSDNNTITSQAIEMFGEDMITVN